MGEDQLLWVLLIAQGALLWVTQMRIERLRATLRQYGIVHDPEKPWEGP